jgi:hypothetical protein
VVIALRPGCATRVLRVGNRPAEGLSEKSPVQAAGIRSEPPVWCGWLAVRFVAKTWGIGGHWGAELRTGVRADAQGAALHGKESGLAARAAAAGGAPVQRAHGTTKDVVDGLGVHGCGGHVGLDVKDGSGTLE